MKKKLFEKAVEKLNNISTVSMGTTSWILLNQPKEPKALTKQIKN